MDCVLARLERASIRKAQSATTGLIEATAAVTSISAIITGIHPARMGNASFLIICLFIFILRFFLSTDFAKDSGHSLLCFSLIFVFHAQSRAVVYCIADLPSAGRRESPQTIFAAADEAFSSGRAGAYGLAVASLCNSS